MGKYAFQLNPERIRRKNSKILGNHERFQDFQRLFPIITAVFIPPNPELTDRQYSELVG